MPGHFSPLAPPPAPARAPVSAQDKRGKSNCQTQTWPAGCRTGQPATCLELHLGPAAVSTCGSMQCHAIVLNCGLQATPSPTTLRLYPTKQGVVTSQKMLLFIWVFYYGFLIHQRLGSKVMFLGSEFSSQAIRPVWGEVPGYMPYTHALMPNRNAAAASRFTVFLSSRAGHGMDSRPAMAIFELLDYIVNEVHT